MAVFVLDRKGRPIMPCSERRARKLLAAGRARVHRMIPFAIRLIDVLLEDCAMRPLRLSIDPGSKTSGLALARMAPVVDGQTGEIGEPVMHIRHLVELVHRGRAIRASLTARRQMRRRRRNCLRYRAPRFENRTRPQGWLAPSLRHRVDTTLAWVARLRRLAPITHLAQELVRFDMQAMQNPEVSGVQYQQGTLAGYEVREYLLEKFKRTCAYCDATDVPLQIEHIHARASGGTERVSNLALACGPCNQKKGARDIREFLSRDPARVTKIQAQAKAPLKDAAAVNSTRWTLLGELRATGLPVESGSGGRTRFNRSRLGIAKTHALDAACVGAVGAVQGVNAPSLQVRCTGRGTRQRTQLDRFGFPRGYLTRHKTVHGFRTGDMVKACVPSGCKAGVHAGRVAIRLTGSFNIQGAQGVVQGISHRHCALIQRGDGYGYSVTEQPKKGSGSRGVQSTPRSASPALRQGLPAQEW